MPRKRVTKAAPPCPLKTDKRQRAAADKLAARIQDDFPAGLSQPALRALARAGYSSLDDLTKVRETELLSLHGLGPKGIETLRAALTAKKLRFRK